MRARLLGQRSNATVTELDRAYGGALAVYQNGEFESAIRTLRAIVDDLESLPETDESYAQWVRAQLRLAHAALSIGHEKEGDDAMHAVARTDPAVQPDAEQYSPTYRRRFEQVRARVRALPGAAASRRRGGAGRDRVRERPGDGPHAARAVAPLRRLPRRRGLGIAPRPELPGRPPGRGPHRRPRLRPRGGAPGRRRPGARARRRAPRRGDRPGRRVARRRPRRRREPRLGGRRAVPARLDLRRPATGRCCARGACGRSPGRCPPRTSARSRRSSSPGSRRAT